MLKRAEVGMSQPEGPQMPWTEKKMSLLQQKDPKPWLNRDACLLNQISPVGRKRELFQRDIFHGQL